MTKRRPSGTSNYLFIPNSLFHALFGRCPRVRIAELWGGWGWKGPQRPPNSTCCATTTPGCSEPHLWLLTHNLGWFWCEFNLLIRDGGTPRKALQLNVFLGAARGRRCPRRHLEYRSNPHPPLHPHHSHLRGLKVHFFSTHRGFAARTWPTAVCSSPKNASAGEPRRKRSEIPCCWGITPGRSCEPSPEAPGGVFFFDFGLGALLESDLRG